MITALLTMAVCWCLFFGRLPIAALAPLCVGGGVALALLGRQEHEGFFAIDVYALSSRLNKVNTGLKFFTALLLMALCIAAKSPLVGLFLTLAMLLLVTLAGGLKLRRYMNLLALPASFLMISGLALLFEVTAQRTGVLSLNVFGLWFSVSVAAQTRAALVMGRALGAVSCLYMLSLTTPMSELIGTLRRIRCPDVLIELMYLIYRYIFILISMYHAMHDAAASRLGFYGYRASVRTTGSLYSNLLSRSYRQANRNFDAMESRCYEKGIRFLERTKKVTAFELAAAAGMLSATFYLFLILR